MIIICPRKDNNVIEINESKLTTGCYGISKGETAEFFDFNQIFNQKNQFNQKIDLIKKISLIKEKHLFSALFHRIYRNNHKQ